MDNNIHIKETTERVRFAKEEIYGERIPRKSSEEDKIIRTLDEAKYYFEDKRIIDVDDIIKYLQIKQRNKEAVLELKSKLVYLTRIINQFQRSPDQATAEVIIDINEYLLRNLK